jgi:hypothetical protein
MNYEKILVVGGDSFIANLIMPELNFPRDRIHVASRRKVGTEIKWADAGNIIKTEFPSSETSIKKILTILSAKQNNSVLVINFTGFFGKPSNLTKLVPKDVIDVIDKNLSPFLDLINFFSQLGPGSMLLSFSGAGVGGDNMDATSPGYLASKLSMGGFVEIFDNILKDSKKRLVLVAPGAFPSKMQMAIIEAPLGAVSEELREKTKMITINPSRLLKLKEAIIWIVGNPDASGGKIWSAQFDDFSTKNRPTNFGLLRRII